MIRTDRVITVRMRSPVRAEACRTASLWHDHEGTAEWRARLTATEPTMR
jgi:hypothetical protein